MSFARRIYERFQLFIHEIAKFGVVGGIAFLATELFFNVLLQAGAGAFVSNAVATFAAAVIAFLGNRYWTFRHRERSGMGRETVVFFALNGVGILIQQTFIEAAKYEFGRHDKLTLNAAFLLGVVLATLFRFWSYRKWVWRLAAPPEPTPAAAHVHRARVVAAAPVVAQLNGHELDERIVLTSGPGRHRQTRP